MPIRILIADDNPSVRAAMRSVLECVDDHWEIIDAADGREALAKAEQFKPHLVILDLVMPGGDGLQASREISRLLPDIPILMHTLYSSLYVELQAASAGIRKVVPKSESSVLVSAVQEVLHPKRSRPRASVSGSSPISGPSSPATVSFTRRTEDKVRELSAKLFALGKNEVQVHSPLLAELRDALHRHIEQLRARVAGYPVVERRKHNLIAPAAPRQRDPRASSPPTNPNSMPTIPPEPPASSRKKTKRPD